MLFPLAVGDVMRYDKVSRSARPIDLLAMNFNIDHSPIFFPELTH
jgi:hypothetical protein